MTIKNTKLKKNLFIRVDADIHKELALVAESTGRTVAGLVRLWINHGLNARGLGSAKKEKGLQADEY